MHQPTADASEPKFTTLVDLDEVIMSKKYLSGIHRMCKKLIIW